MKKRLQDLTADERYLLQKVAQHEMIVKLFAYIAIDLQVCELEGWDKMEFINLLHEEIDYFVQKSLTLNQVGS